MKPKPCGCFSNLIARISSNPNYCSLFQRPHLLRFFPWTIRSAAIAVLLLAWTKPAGTFLLLWSSFTLRKYQKILMNFTPFKIFTWNKQQSTIITKTNSKILFEETIFIFLVVFLVFRTKQLKSALLTDKIEILRDCCESQALQLNLQSSKLRAFSWFW